jgi:hypothetical protein
MPRGKRSKNVNRGRDNNDEMTLGNTQSFMVGQSGFLKDGGGGACKGCGTVCSTLFLDGTGPCCHKTVEGGSGELCPERKSRRKSKR